MNLSALFKISGSLFVVLATLLVFVLSVNAQEGSGVYENQGDEPILVSTVEIYDARILTTSGNRFNIAFDIKNRVGAQGQVYYGIQLKQDSANGGMYIADEHSFSEVLSISGGELLNKEVVYEAPKYLDGEFEVFVITRNKNGVLSAFDKAGEVTLSGEKRLEINIDSCMLSGGNQEDRSVQRGSILIKNENLEVSCDIKNHFNTTQNVDIMVEVFEGSVFGRNVSNLSIDSLILSGNSKGNMEFTIPSISGAGDYLAKAYLSSGGEVVSNPVYVTYKVLGENASITNIILDKDSYRKGNVMEISFFWSGSGNKDSQEVRSPLTGATLDLTVKNDENENCINPISSEPLSSDWPPVKTINAEVISTCDNPMLTALVKNARGDILDEEEYAIKSKGRSVNIILIIGIFTLLIAVIIILFVVNRNKKNSMNDNIPMQFLLILFIVVAMFSLSGFGQANAAYMDFSTIYDYRGYYFGGGERVYIQTNKPSYQEGEIVELTIDLAQSTEFSDENNLSNVGAFTTQFLDVKFDGEWKNAFFGKAHWNNNDLSNPLYHRKVTFTAPAPGNYDVTVKKRSGRWNYCGAIRKMGTAMEWIGQGGTGAPMDLPWNSTSDPTFDGHQGTQFDWPLSSSYDNHWANGKWPDYNQLTSLRDTSDHHYVLVTNFGWDVGDAPTIVTNCLTDWHTGNDYVNGALSAVYGDAFEIFEIDDISTYLPAGDEIENLVWHMTQVSRDNTSYSGFSDLSYNSPSMIYVSDFLNSFGDSGTGIAELLNYFRNPGSYSGSDFYNDIQVPLYETFGWDNHIELDADSVQGFDEMLALRLMGWDPLAPPPGTSLSSWSDRIIDPNWNYRNSGNGYSTDTWIRAFEEMVGSVTTEVKFGPYSSLVTVDAPPSPDLRAVNLQLPSSALGTDIEGVVHSFDVTIENIGGVAVPPGSNAEALFEIDINNDDNWTTLGEVSIADLDASGGANTDTVSINWTTVTGKHKFRVTADANNDVSEADETNNILVSGTFTIKGVVAPDITFDVSIAGASIPGKIFAKILNVIDIVKEAIAAGSVVLGPTDTDVLLEWTISNASRCWASEPVGQVTGLPTWPGGPDDAGTTPSDKHNVSSSQTIGGLTDQAHFTFTITCENGSGGPQGTANVNVGLCGDGVIQPTDEQCDGANLGGETCSDQGFLGIGGPLQCDSSCDFNTSSCTNPICGNNVAEGSEECDGTDLNGGTCASEGLPGTAGLTCWGPTDLEQCKVNTSTCTLTQCNDEKDNDGDLAIDLADGGCDDINDNLESNCGDGICYSLYETPSSCPADCRGGGGEI